MKMCDYSLATVFTVLTITITITITTTIIIIITNQAFGMCQSQGL
jgi:hypothetical protein